MLKCLKATAACKTEIIMKKIKLTVSLFLTMLKIGLFTFGGGYAMIALLENEFAEKKKWIDKEEFLNMVAIAESTPGPIAINSATYIGYKTAGVLGSVFATLGVALPSFTVIFTISLFFDEFLSLKLVEYAFRGIQVCVVYLIMSAGIKMLRAIKKDPLEITLLSLTVLGVVTTALLAVSFSSVIYILAGGTAGVAFHLITEMRKKKVGDLFGTDADIGKKGEENEHLS